MSSGRSRHLPALQDMNVVRDFFWILERTASGTPGEFDYVAHCPDMNRAPERFTVLGTGCNGREALSGLRQDLQVGHVSTGALQGIILSATTVPIQFQSSSGRQPWQFMLPKMLRAKQLVVRPERLARHAAQISFGPSQSHKYACRGKSRSSCCRKLRCLWLPTPPYSAIVR